MTVVLTERDPLPLPDTHRDLRIDGRSGFLHSLAKIRGNLPGKQVDRHKKSIASRFPMLTIRRDPTASDQQMDMGVIAQLPIPGVKHGQDTRDSPQEPFLGAQILDRRGRHLHQQAIEQLLMATEQPTQFRRNCRHGVKIVARQKFGLTLLQPLLGLAALAFGASPIPTAVVLPKRPLAVIAAIQSPTQFASAAGRDIRQCLLLRRQHLLVVSGLVLGAELADNVRQFNLRLRFANRAINHRWAAFLRRGRRWSWTEDRGVGLAMAPSGACRSPSIAGSNDPARSG